MSSLTTQRLALKRLVDDWRLMLSIFIGILVATTLVAGAPIYMRALERMAVATAIDRAPDTTLNLLIFAPNIALNRGSINASQEKIDLAIDRNISEIYRGQRRFLRSDTFVAGLPSSPLDRNAQRNYASRAYVQYMSNIEDNIYFLDGRMATDAIITDADSTVIEVILGAPSLEVFQLQVGDEVEITPYLAHPSRVRAKIVGIFEPTDPQSEFWRRNSNLFLRPLPPQEAPVAGVDVSPNEPPLPFFTTKTAFLDGVGAPFPGSLINSTWAVMIDKEILKTWPIRETRDRLSVFDTDITASFPGSIVLSGIENLFGNYEQRSLFSSIPLMLLLALMVVTILYYLLMMVSYLVQNREGDIARLKTRGITTWQVLRLYATESFLLVSIAVVVAPPLATGLISVAGYLPYFTDITRGSLLPAKIESFSFLVSLIVGLVCCVIYVAPGVLGSRSGLVSQKMRSSRPPTTPFFQRYYLDVALIILGGLVFWELYSRGNLASGGLFTDVQINETLLLAPVLFLAAVGLVFMRFFPLLIQFVSGESARLLHLVVAVIVITLSAGLGIREAMSGNTLGWIGPALIALGVGAAYYPTQRAETRLGFSIGILAQSGLVAAYMLLHPIQQDDIFTTAKIAAIAIIPTQLVFLGLKAFISRAPVWVSIGLWQMARNPLQYSWLILLLVLVTGLGILATTVGGTLDRSHSDRINYQTATDIRVANFSGDTYASEDQDMLMDQTQGDATLKAQYQALSNVNSVVLGVRGRGAIRGTGGGVPFEVLGLEADAFAQDSWYRDDFSERSLSATMRSIESDVNSDSVVLPKGATEIGLYLKPSEELGNLYVWVALQDRTGDVSTLTLGPAGPVEWHLIRRDIPNDLVPPIHLVSVQIYEPAFGPTGTASMILMDDIHAVVEDQVVQLEGFENGNRWTPIITAPLSSDKIQRQNFDVFSGQISGMFTFGKDTENGVRGFYHSPSDGFIPVIASRSFVENTNSNIDDVMTVDIMGGTVPIRITDMVEYFPTLNPTISPFIIADMQTLLRYLRILSPTSKPSPNEMFLTHVPGKEGEVVESLLDRLGRVQPIKLYARNSQLEAIRLDPLITAGWKAMVILSLFVIVLTAGLGYTTYLLSFSGRSRIQMGSLQTLGVSSKQLIGLLSMEHLVIAIFGLGLGTWAGFEMSKIMVQSVAVTETGARVIPPFILTTSWVFMGAIYIILSSIFVTAVAILHRGVTKMDLQTVSRQEAM